MIRDNKRSVLGIFYDNLSEVIDHSMNKTDG